MIEVKVIQNNDNILSIESSGHANYDEKGKDIVCSAVSAILIGGLNAIKDIDSYKVTQREGYLKFELVGDNQLKEDNIVLKTLIIQLKTIEYSYKDYLKLLVINK